MTVDIETNESTVTLVDRIERRQLSLQFPTAVSPTPAGTDQFVYPVDEAIEVRASEIVVERSEHGSVLDDTGDLVADISPADGQETIPPGTYYIPLASIIKTYLHVSPTEPFTVSLDPNAGTFTVDFQETLPMRIGARSAHDRPEATITTTPNPTDVMTALSYLGSALKDLGPMRSYPTLRGHPPEIELGEELHVPDELDRPETVIHLVLPPEYRYIYPVASLAYYLGAEVIPGREPHLTTDEGYVYPLCASDGFEAEVGRVLKRVFFLDCVVRSAGPYSHELADADEVRNRIGIDPEALYDRSLAEQVETYLDVPHEAVDPHLPEWSAAAHLEFLPDSVEYLPFLADDLATIRTPEVETRVAGDLATVADDDFTRSAAAAEQNSTMGPASPGDSSSATLASPDTAEAGSAETADGVDWPSGDPSVIEPVSLPAQTQLWIGDDIPVGAERPTIEAYRNALDRDPVDDTIEIRVVCNDDRMAAEDETVRTLLGAQTPFDVRIRPYRGLLVEELRELLRRDTDFFHYIGHIDDQGFACADGYLDVQALDTVGVDTFFLNACSSYRQGEHLIDAGASAGVVTLADVENNDAASVGQLVARLLNNGFPLNIALDVAVDEHGENRYTILGDGSLQITQTEGSAHLTYVDEMSEDTVACRHHAFHSAEHELGSLTSPNLGEGDEWYLTGKDIPFEADREVFEEYLTYEQDIPIRRHGRLEWTGGR